MTIIIDGQIHNFGEDDYRELLEILCVGAAQRCKLQFEKIPIPNLAWNFWLDINPSRTVLEITKIEDRPDEILTEYEITYFDGEKVTGGFLWHPNWTWMRLRTLFEDIRKHYS